MAATTHKISTVAELAAILSIIGRVAGPEIRLLRCDRSAGMGRGMHRPRVGAESTLDEVGHNEGFLIEIADISGGDIGPVDILEQGTTVGCGIVEFGVSSGFLLFLVALGWIQGHLLPGNETVRVNIFLVFPHIVDSAILFVITPSLTHPHFIRLPPSSGLDDLPLIVRPILYIRLPLGTFFNQIGSIVVLG